MPIRLAILTTHPIQYQVPWFRHMARQDWVKPYVLFGDDHGLKVKRDREFGAEFAWDLPMLEGYEHEFLENRSRHPSVDHFDGVSTPSIFQKLTRERFDAVLALGWHTKSFWQGFRAARLAGLPLVLRGESNLLQPRPLWKTLARQILLKRVFKQAMAFLAIGSLNRQFYLAHGVAVEKIYAAPYFVDNERFGAGMAKRDGVRSRLGVGADEFIFIFSGKLVERKRPIDLLEAWGRLSSESREMSRVIFVGSGALRPELERRAAEISPDRVRFLGFCNQTELPELYAAADAIVLPSDYGETWGLSVNEAMAAGCRAVVSNRVGCAPDLVIGGETGEVFPCGDIPFLRGILQRYVQDRAWLRDPARRKRVLDQVADFTMERATQTLRDVLE